MENQDTIKKSLYGSVENVLKRESGLVLHIITDDDHELFVRVHGEHHDHDWLNKVVLINPQEDDDIKPEDYINFGIAIDRKETSKRQSEIYDLQSMLFSRSKETI